MAESKHTPLPWRVYLDDRTGEPAGVHPGIESPNGTIVLFGDVGEGDMGVHGHSPEEALANAHFIVQAVNAHDDLVAACEQVLRDVGDRLTGKTVLMLRAALRKAGEGRS